MKYTYEAHIINNRELPFLFHRDRMTAVSNSWPNYHTNIELLFCFEGEGTVICGTRKYNFSAGDIIVVNTNVLHAVSSDSLVRYYCLIVDEDFCLSNGIDVSKLYFDTHICNDEAREAYDDVCKAFASREDAKVPAVRYAVLGLLLLLVRKFSEPVDENMQKSDFITAKRIKKIVEYIQSNLNSSISLDDISEHIGISKYHLSRDFKKFTGSTVFEYINMSRCKTAAGLIASGMSVSAAASECGFENLSYFSRTYKKYMGTLPSKHR